ncbi:hypothetical protein GGR57DRAFT_67299 [Xylariaceae sp. FL1272]|nr:hypothetical protein GGR57DRAFT_67299 [Xylariaceae sp. FL1272]
MASFAPCCDSCLANPRTGIGSRWVARKCLDWVAANQCRGVWMCGLCCGLLQAGANSRERGLARCCMHALIRQPPQTPARSRRIAGTNNVISLSPRYSNYRKDRQRLSRGLSKPREEGEGGGSRDVQCEARSAVSSFSLVRQGDEGGKRKKQREAAGRYTRAPLRISHDKSQRGGEPMQLNINNRGAVGPVRRRATREDSPDGRISDEGEARISRHA